MKKKRKLNSAVTMRPDSAKLITESLLRLVDSHKEELLQILKGR